MIEISCFNGMAGSKRVRNLMLPLINKDLIKLNNLIFQADIKELSGKGNLDDINYQVIDYRVSNIFTILKFFFSGMAYIKKCKQPNLVNILYNYGGPNIKNILFICYAKTIGYKIICDVVEDNRYEIKVSFLNGFKTKSSLVLLKYIRHFADGLIGITTNLHNRLLTFSKGKIPVFTIPISVNLNAFKNQAYSATNMKLNIFYGGSFNEKDGLEYLIPAFDEVSKKYDNVELILTGHGVPSDIQRVQAVINKTVNKSKIIHKGFLETNDYYNLLNSCDIFCMTRIDSGYSNAGFPFKLGEFLASGRAVIATNVSEVPEYLSDKVNALIIAPNSVVEIINALSFLIENPDNIGLIGKEGRKVAEQFFDSEKVSMKLFSIFQSI